MFISFLRVDRLVYLTVGVGIIAALLSAVLLEAAWWVVVFEAILFAALAVLVWEREQRLRQTTERVIGRALGESEPVATAWLRWARSVKEQLRAAMRERRDVEVVLESMGEGVVVLDTSQQISRVNSAAERLLGIERKNVLGRYYREVLPQKDLIHFIASVLHEGSLTEVDIKLTEGDPRYVQASGQVLLAPPQSARPAAFGGMVVVLNEVTRLRRLERARRDFVANVSHELKTPITSIQGFVETLADGAIDSREDAMRFLGIIKRQSDRLGQIFNDMLTLSRIESELDLEAAPADLFTIVQSVVNSLDWKARERGVSVEVRGQSVRGWVNGQLIEQAVSNLIDNAIKYGGSGKPGVSGQVTVSVEERPGVGVITITDNGLGIDSQHLPRIFERFYRIDKGRSRSEGGTGLGLAIVKHIAQAHGGSATVMSQVGVGTTFTLELPLRQEHA